MANSKIESKGVSTERTGELLESSKGKTPEFKPKITPTQVNEKLGEDKKKAAAKKTQEPTPKSKKEPAQKKDKTVTFPASIRVNAYGFIGMRRGLLEAPGWKLGENLKIDKNPDGSVTVRKA